MISPLPKSNPVPHQSMWLRSAPFEISGSNGAVAGQFERVPEFQSSSGNLLCPCHHSCLSLPSLTSLRKQRCWSGCCPRPSADTEERHGGENLLVGQPRWGTSRSEVLNLSTIDILSQKALFSGGTFNSSPDLRPLEGSSVHHSPPSKVSPDIPKWPLGSKLQLVENHFSRCTLLPFLGNRCPENLPAIKLPGHVCSLRRICIGDKDREGESTLDRIMWEEL